MRPIGHKTHFQKGQIISIYKTRPTAYLSQKQKHIQSLTDVHKMGVKLNLQISLFFELAFS